MGPRSKQTEEGGPQSGIATSQYGALCRLRRTWWQQLTARPERGGPDSCTWSCHASFLWGSLTHPEDSCCSSLQSLQDFPRLVSVSVLQSCGSQRKVEVAPSAVVQEDFWRQNSLFMRLPPSGLLHGATDSSNQSSTKPAIALGRLRTLPAETCPRWVLFLNWGRKRF